MFIINNHHLLLNSDRAYCENYDERPDENDISLLVIHNISLPPGKFITQNIIDFFQNKLNEKKHIFFKEIRNLKVSAHCLITRSGKIIQFVPFNKRAWHAGQSSFEKRSGCNDYSIGIELEGTDEIPYTDEQYNSLVEVSIAIMEQYPLITLDRITGHEFIAPERKTDPGVSFDWFRYKSDLEKRTKCI